MIRLQLDKATSITRIFTVAMLYVVVMTSAWLADTKPAEALSVYTYCQPDSDGDAVGFGAGTCSTASTCSAGYTLVRTSLNDATCASIYTGGPNENDNCPAVANSSQTDANGNGIGDACDGTPQTITITTPAPATAVNGSSFTVAATASSGLTVAITTTGGCSIAGGIVTMTSSTTACIVLFNQAGTPPSGYSPATQVTSITKIAQTITVTTPAPANAANTSYFNVAATATSGLTVAITVSGGCTIASGIVTINSAVTACVVNYNQAGNTNIGVAPQVTSTTNVNAGIAQTITVTTPAPVTAMFNSSFPVAAIASSGLAVTITASGGCSFVAGSVAMSNSTNTVACTVNYTQSGNAAYLAATTITSVTVVAVLNPVQITSGFFHNCVLASMGVHCWGAGTTNVGGINFGQSLVPALVNPVQLSAGGYHTCALDDTGVVCWGRNNYGQTTVPALVNPVQVSAGDYHTCVLDNNGVHCWGAGTTNIGSGVQYGQSIVPLLVNPTQISAGLWHTCALDDTGVVCWGQNTYGQTTVPALVNPVLVSTGNLHTCALDNTGVHCWGYNGYGQTTVPVLVNPVQVSLANHTCALDATGVHCWGAGTTNTGGVHVGQSIVPVLNNPVQISAGDSHTCALDNTGVVCWGQNNYGQAVNIAAQYASVAQTITVTTPAPTSAALNSTFPVAATASSGLTVAITVSGGCTIAAGVVTMTSAVTACTVNYDQAGNGTYFAAPQVTSNTLVLVDTDSDGIADTSDNCPAVSNAAQTDTDLDSIGDACDTDMDGDGIPNTIDGDIDGDGVANAVDSDPLSAASAAELILPLDGTSNGASVSSSVQPQ